MVAPSILLGMLQKEKERRLCESSLYKFVKYAWPIVDPGAPFVPGKHMDIICAHLEAVVHGDIKRLLVNIPPRHALTLDTHIPTPKGLVPMSDLNTGDFVYGPDGKAIKVLGKSEVFRSRQVYKVTTDDGASIQVDGDHLWTVRIERKYKTYTTEQLWLRQRTKRGGGVDLRLERKCLPMLPEYSEIDYPERFLLVDPYVLGVWLGDGSRGSGEISQEDEDAKTLIHEIEKRGFKTSKRKTKYRFGVLGLLVKLGILHDKRIPEEYLFASAFQRRELLRGLMDTDGNVSKKGFFSQSDKAFILQVQQLIRSLGIKCSISECIPKIGDVEYKTVYRATFYASDIAYLKRKEDRTLKGMRGFGRYISIERLDNYADMQCITVDRPDGLFLAGDGYVVTHNSKSSIISVMFPMWLWLQRPEAQFLCASYSGVLSIRDNLKSRRLVTSPWYQERWGDKVTLCGDQNSKTRFENTSNGYRIATSVGGSATGEGANFLLGDDLMSASDAQSEALRNTALDWFTQVWSSRLNNPREDVMIVIEQRLHENDISGYIIDTLKDWQTVVLPAEFDGVKRKTVLGYYDKRKKGELLCPERFGRKEVDALKVLLGIFGVSGQLQQNPSPPEGGILKPSYFGLWPQERGLPQFEYILQSYDCAFTEKTTGDPTACTVWGVFTYKSKRNAMLLDAWSEYLAYPDMRKRVIDDWTAEYSAADKLSPFSRPKRPDRLLVEEKASGLSLLQDLRLAKVPAVPYNPGNADKVSRAHQAAPTLETGILWIPESQKTPGQPVSWAVEFTLQLAKFPRGKHDDFVDTFTQAIIYLKNDRWFDLQEAKDVDDDLPRKKREHVNPYAA